jgi:hypothetical protein
MKTRTKKIAFASAAAAFAATVEAIILSTSASSLTTAEAMKAAYCGHPVSDPRFGITIQCTRVEAGPATVHVGAGEFAVVVRKAD